MRTQIEDYILPVPESLPHIAKFSLFYLPAPCDEVKVAREVWIRKILEANVKEAGREIISVEIKYLEVHPSHAGKIEMTAITKPKGGDDV